VGVASDYECSLSYVVGRTVTVAVVEVVVGWCYGKLEQSDSVDRTLRTVSPWLCMRREGVSNRNFCMVDLADLAAVAAVVSVGRLVAVSADKIDMMTGCGHNLHAANSAVSVSRTAARNLEVVVCSP